MANTESSTAEELVDRLAHPTDADVAAVDAWWRANNYLTVGQIYLMANPLLREPLSSDHIKPRLLGHWGTSPGLALVYAHASRLIQQTGQQMIYVAGPGHGGPTATFNRRLAHGGWTAAELVRLAGYFDVPVTSLLSGLDGQVAPAQSG